MFVDSVETESFVDFYEGYGKVMFSWVSAIPFIGGPVQDRLHHTGTLNELWEILNKFEHVQKVDTAPPPPTSTPTRQTGPTLLLRITCV